MNLKCKLGFHEYEYFVDKLTSDPMRGCPRCDKVQTKAVSFGLFFWHDLAEGWTFTNWRAYRNAKTWEEKRKALET